MSVLGGTWDLREVYGHKFNRHKHAYRRSNIPDKQMNIPDEQITANG